jgi:hypothetical protein
MSIRCGFVMLADFLGRTGPGENDALVQPERTSLVFERRAGRAISDDQELGVRQGASHFGESTDR